MLVLYGLGTTVGAGIYSLLGEVARVAGYFAPWSFLLASLLAALTATSFAELSARYPRAAGVALYVEHGFSSRGLSLAVGMLVMSAGLVSSAALLNGFVGYALVFVDVERVVIIACCALLIGSIAAWGIVQSVLMASVVTVVELAGLYLVIAVNDTALLSVVQRWPELVPPSGFASWSGIYAGILLAFYAFIGFEDMVDVAEEVKNVQRNLPLAILLTIIVTMLTYLLLMTTAVLAMPPEQLGRSTAPLAELYMVGTSGSGTLISAIGLFAIINGALIQVIMSARVMYGLSSRGLLPAVLSHVHPRTRTPLAATGLASSIMLFLALLGGLASLASLTSMIILSLFVLVNASLWRIKRREPMVSGVISFPRWISALGAVVSLGFVLLQVGQYVHAF
ncbi:MAG: APC family permease [bacterium]